MKRNFETPEIKIEEFHVEDVITTSGDGPEVGGGGLPVMPS